MFFFSAFLVVAISFDNVQAFIDGVSDEVPKLPERLVSAKRYFYHTTLDHSYSSAFIMQINASACEINSGILQFTGDFLRENR